MTPTEKLERIKLRCQQLLAIAEKRTKGKWAVCSPIPFVTGEEPKHSVHGPPSDFMYLQNVSDAQFIAACAGPAEAGWRATIAAIDDSIRQPVPEGWCHPDNPVFCENTPLINKILSVWPEELL